MSIVTPCHQALPGPVRELVRPLVDFLSRYGDTTTRFAGSDARAAGRRAEAWT